MTSPSSSRTVLCPEVVLMKIDHCLSQDVDSCTNCAVRITHDNFGMKLTDILVRQTRADVVFEVSVLEALDVIFDVMNKSRLSPFILEEEKYVICWKCTCLLTQLYRLFIGFTDCSNVKTFMESIIGQNKPLKAYHERISREIPNTELDNLDFQDELIHKTKTSRSSDFQRDDRNSNYISDDDWDSNQTANVNVQPVRPFVNLRRSRRRIEPNPNGAAAVPKLAKCQPNTDMFLGCDRKEHLDLQKPKKRGAKPPNTVNKQKHRCKDCSARFLRPNLLKLHSERAHRIKKYFCTRCRGGFSTFYFLKIHQRDCPVPKVGTKRMRLKSKSKLSVISKGSNVLLKAETVQQNTDSRIPLLEVQDNGRQEKLLKGNIQTSKKNARKHIPRPALKFYTCSECHAVLTTEKRLKNHVRLTHFNREFTCKRCGAGFAKQYFLGLHTSSYVCSKPDTPRFTCSECNKILASQDRLDRHLQVSHSSNTFFCKRCTAGFGCKTSLLRHNKFCSGIKTTQIFEQAAYIQPSPEAPKITSLAVLKTHSNKKFVRKSRGLNYKSRAAQEIDKDLPTKSARIGEPKPVLPNNTEKLTNTNTGSSKREMCPLRRKKHTCRECRAEFGAKNALLCHARTVHSNRKFVCSKCRAVFGAQSTYYRHFAQCSKSIVADKKLKPAALSSIKLSTSTKIKFQSSSSVESQPVKSLSPQPYRASTNSSSSPRKKFPCLECSALLDSAHLLDCHSRGHLQKLYICKACGGGFSTLHYRQRHRKDCTNYAGVGHLFSRVSGVQPKSESESRDPRVPTKAVRRNFKLEMKVETSKPQKSDEDKLFEC